MGNALKSMILNTSINKNGIKSYGKQNYIGKDCKKQFIVKHQLTYKGYHSQANNQVKNMMVNACGIRSIAKITGFNKF